MPINKVPLNGFGRIGLAQATAAMVDASVDTIAKAQQEASAEELKEQVLRQQLEERAERENMPKVYVLKEQYHKLDPDMIRSQEEKHHYVLIPAEEHEIQRMKEQAVPYTMPPKLPDITMLQPPMLSVPHVKGGRHHEPPRDLKKKKKAKRRAQKQARRKR